MKKYIIPLFVIAISLFIVDCVKAQVTWIVSGNATTTIANLPIGYPGTGWIPNIGGGDGSTALNKTNCQLATGANGWVWFADANGNGTVSDGDDGECVATTTSSFGIAGYTDGINVISAGQASWNGAVNMVASSTAGSIAVTGGTYNTLTTSGLTAGSLVNSLVVSIGSRTCWGMVKANDTSSVTVYGYWRASGGYGACASNPINGDTFRFFDDYKYDNSWIGDYTCSGNFPNGLVVHHNYPPFPNTFGFNGNATTSALEIADCKDGKRDLLPNTSDRAVLSGTLTGVVNTASSFTMTDSSLASPQAMSAGQFMGQELLITGGTGVGSYGTIEDNTTNTFTATTTGSSWTGTAPAVGSTYSVIYIVPRASYLLTAGQPSANDAGANKGPLNQMVLDGWKGTRLPTMHDFFGVCGAPNFAGSTISNYYSSGATSNRSLGNYGSNVGRGINAGNTNFLNLSNSGSWEWLSQQYYYNDALVVGNNACSYVNNSNVFYSDRFGAVFRP